MASSQKIKVLYLITKGGWGGAQCYVYDLASNLSKDQSELVVAFGLPGVLADKLSQVGIHAITLKRLGRAVNIFDDVLTGIELIRLFKKERPDVVHLNSSKIGVIGALAARLAGVPNIIFTAHGWAFNEERPSVSRAIIKLLQWLTIVLSHRTICVAEAVKDRVANWPLVRKKLTVIHNGLAPFELLDRETTQQQLFGERDYQDKIIISAVAELHRNKGLDFAIRALAQLNNPRLILAIAGEGEEKQNLKRLAIELSVADQVWFLGQVPDAPKYLKAFDIFILPSRTEAFPYAVLEAGWTGLPVIASAVGGISEIISDQETGLLCPAGDVAALASKIKMLADDVPLRQQLGDALKQKVLDQFLLEKMLSQTLRTYKK